MSSWPQRAVFRDTVSAYRTREGINLQGMADLLRIKLSTLHTYLYGKKGKPSLELLQRVSELTGVSVYEFIDNPGAEFADGLIADPEARFFSRLIVRDMGSEDLTNEDRKALYDAFRWHLEQVRRKRSGK